MAHDPGSVHDPVPRSWSVKLGQAVRNYFFSGLATLFPVAVTVWLLVMIFLTTDRLLRKLLGFQIPGLGLVVTVLVIVGVGVVSVHVFGRVVVRTFELWFGRLPLVKRIHPALRQFAQFFFGDESRQVAFRRVVFVQYPRPGIYSLAFITNEQTTHITGVPQTLYTLLIPTPPSPFTGPVIFVPQDQVVPLDLSVEETLKLILSAGVVAPPLRAPAPPPGG